jgi:hypothetical protein
MRVSIVLMLRRPIAGSKTDLRGRKAKSHICREILELCTVIHDVGTYNTKKRDPDDDDEHCIDDGTIIVSFGELFQVSTDAIAIIKYTRSGDINFFSSKRKTFYSTTFFPTKSIILSLDSRVK